MSKVSGRKVSVPVKCRVTEGLLPTILGGDSTRDMLGPVVNLVTTAVLMHHTEPNGESNTM